MGVYMDKKLETFLTLCKTMNYRVAAQKLHLTQPAVTKQIQSLENEYNTRLFEYDGKKLYKTAKGGILESYASSLEYNYQKLRLAMEEKEHQHLRIGATKTVGDYYIGSAVMQYLKNPDHELSLIVENTKELLEKLDDNALDFAIIEGLFDKKRYAHRLLKTENFVGICQGKSVLSGKKIDSAKIERLFEETLIIREKGSGTRDIFERELNGMGYTIDDFKRVIELSSFSLILEAVEEGLGISFAYEAVVRKKKSIGKFILREMKKEHEFNVVSLKNTNAGDYASKFLDDAGLGTGCDT